jgi:hypothetical protein
MAEIGAPVPAEEYDYTVPKPKHGGLAILASLLFLGGGQLVRALSLPLLKLSLSRRWPPAG